MDPPAATAKHVKRCHKRLSPDAYALLCRRSIIAHCSSRHRTDHFVGFFDNVSRSPTSAQNVELTDTIRKLRGCEWCTVSTVRRYFANKRAHERRKAKANLIEVKAEPPSSSMLPYLGPLEVSSGFSPSTVDDRGYLKMKDKQNSISLDSMHLSISQNPQTIGEDTDVMLGGDLKSAKTLGMIIHEPLG